MATTGRLQVSDAVAGESQRFPHPPRRRQSGARQLLRAVGWCLLGAGAVILLYLIYTLFFTGLTTQAAQDDLLQRWELEVGEVDAPQVPSGGPVVAEAVPPAAVDPGDALAVLEFFRPGSDTRPVQDGPLFTVEGVGVGDLRRGPGHYPGTALPGKPGNFAVAGHRTTYGAPFFNLDQLQPGDEVHVTDRQGVRWIYAVTEQRIVSPTDTWVIGADPLGSGRPTLTLTTCNPRFSNAQRLIVFGELRGPAA